MYQDRISHKQRNILLIVLCALVLACGYFAFSGSGKDLDEETVTAIRDAIRRSALQCYVVEGVYPPDLAYLQDFYQRINAMEIPVYRGVCPHCGKEVEIPVNFTEAGA